MKMRKLFAGLAAAATLLSGMAIGVAAAQADDAPLLQVNHAQEGHTYTPYKFATFENPGDGSVEVKTVDAWKGAVTTAADVADGSHNGIPTEYKDNPDARLCGDVHCGSAPCLRQDLGWDYSAGRT